MKRLTWIQVALFIMSLVIFSIVLFQLNAPIKAFSKPKQRLTEARGEQRQRSPTKTNRYGVAQNKEYVSSAEIDARVDKFIRNGQHVGIIYANGLTEQAKAALGFTEEQSRQIQDALNEAKASIGGEIDSRIEKVDETDGGVVEYKMAAFPDRAVEIQNAFKEKITPITGTRLAEIATEMMLVEPTYLGFGMNDLYFRVAPTTDGQKDEKSWLIYHEERLPNTTDIISHNEWNAADFIRLCHVFSFQ